MQLIKNSIEKISLVSNIKHKTKDPIRYPKVQCGYEKATQVIFAAQMNNMILDLTKEMIKIKLK